MEDLTPLCPTMEPTVWFHREEYMKFFLLGPPLLLITPDFIPFKFIKMVLNHLLYPLEHLFNLSYLRAEVPDRWKHSLVTPVPKKAPYNRCENYRPISITSIFARAFEKILKRRLIAHLDEHNIISGSQHGFHKGRSVEAALLTSLNDWTIAVRWPTPESYKLDKILLAKPYVPGPQLDVR
ncbi:hypothetical protein COOONC_27921 [Cooperia oncophora]